MKFVKKFKEEKKKNFVFVNAERNMSINKDNQILLSKLVEISSGKYSSVPKVVKEIVYPI